MSGKYVTSKIFQAAFGVNMPIFIPWDFFPHIPPHFDFEGYVMDDQETEATSYLQTPVMFPMTFAGGTYKKYNINGELEEVQLEDFTLPFSTLLIFRRAKNITRTNVLGSTGTVKEIYGFDDWIIDVKGLCLNENSRGNNHRVKAQETLKKILEWEVLADSIELKANALFNQIGIGAVTISDWSHQVLQGQDGAVAFQFTMYSDEFKELQLIGD